MDSTFPVRDERPEGWFRIDHALLEEYGKDMGPYGIAVYTALAHHVNAQRSCWPSYARLAKLTGMSRVKVITTIEQLEQLGVIRKETRKVEGMDEHTTNRYILVPLSAVVPLPRAEVVNDVNHGGKRGEPPQYTTDTTLVNDVNHGGKRGEPKQESLNKNQEQEVRPARATGDMTYPPGTAIQRRKDLPPIKPVPKPSDDPAVMELYTTLKALPFPTRDGKIHSPKLALLALAGLNAATRNQVLTGAGHYAAAYKAGLTDDLPKDLHNWIHDLDYLEWQEPAVPQARPLRLVSNGSPVPAAAPPLPRLDKAYWQAQKGR